MIEIPDHYGYIDSDAYDNGAPGSAALRREVIRNNNRLVARAGVMDVHIASTHDAENRFRGMGSIEWRDLRGPIICQKKPGISLGMLSITAKVESGDEDFELKVRTQVNGAINDADDWNQSAVISAADTNWHHYLIDNIPISIGPMEVLTYRIRGGKTSTSLGTGTAEAGNFTYQELYDSFATFSATWEDAAYIIFENGSTHYVGEVPDANTIRFWPAISGFNPFGLNYEIFELGKFQIGSLNFYWKERDL